MEKSMNTCCTLLEQIRSKPPGMFRYYRDTGNPVEDRKQKLVNPIGKDKKESMEILLKHRFEFPPTVREAIVQPTYKEGNNHDSPEDIFFQRFEEALFRYVLGENTSLTPLYQCTDSMDHVELVLRFYPTIWDAHELLHYSFKMIQDDKAIDFVPLFVTLALEVQSYNNGMDPLEFLMKDLFVNGLEGPDGNPAPNPELAMKSLAVMLKLQKLVEWEAASDAIELVQRLFSKLSFYEDSDFFEQRLRLLIGWAPSLLLPNAVYAPICGRISSTLLSDGDFEMFQLLLELGMLHYPTELGFVFHLNSGLGEPYNEYLVACYNFGKERVAQAVDDILMRFLGRVHSTSKLQALFLTVASSDDISRDGKYCFLRCANSLICCPESPTTRT